MSDVISFVISLLFIACLIYVPICAIVALARSLATPEDGKMTRENPTLTWVLCVW